MILLRVFFILFIVTIFSCNTKDTSNCFAPSHDDIINGAGNQLDTSLDLSNDPDMKIYTEKRILPIKGGQYSFYNNNVLKEYSFYQNSTIARYMENYDQNGNLIRREGNPILFTKIEGVSKDSLVFNLYVSKLSIKPIKSFIVVNMTDTIQAEPTQEISFSNSVKYQAGIKILTIGKVDFRSALVYTNCNGDKFTILDSGYIYH